MSQDPRFKSQSLLLVVVLIVIMELCLFGLLFIFFSHDKGSVTQRAFTKRSGVKATGALRCRHQGGDDGH